MTIREKLDLAEAEFIRRMRNREPLLKEDEIQDLYLTYDRYGTLVNVHVYGLIFSADTGYCYASLDYKSGLINVLDFPHELDKFCNLYLLDYLIEYYEDHPVTRR